MVDQTDFEPKTDADGRLGRVLTRRNVIKTTAWTVPTVAVVVGVPTAAVASPNDALLTAVYDPNSFRANSNAELTSGTPSAGGFAPVAVTLNITRGPIPDLKCVLAASGNGVGLANNSVSPARGGTTWAIANADIANAGFTISGTTIGGAQTNSFTFMKATATASSVVLKFVLNSIGNTDFPITLTFSSTATNSTSVVTLTSPATTPFLSGSVVTTNPT